MANELEKLMTIGKTLNEKIGITELSLISFCDTYKAYLLELGRQAENEDTMKSFAEMTLYINSLQAQYTDFKNKFNISLFAISKH